MSPLRRVRARRRFDVERPLVEGTIAVGGARLGFAEFGDPGGRPVVWMHGTPGARRQLAPLAKGHAATSGVRVIGLERPGVGWSSPQRYQKIVDFADDVERVADALQLERFGVVGLSGGGPYALACAHRLGERVAAVGVLGGVAPRSATRPHRAVPPPWLPGSRIRSAASSRCSARRCAWRCSG